MTTNPLEYHVQQILDNPNYLTKEQTKAIREVLPEERQARASTLKSQLERINRLMEKLDALSTSSQDVGEMRQVMSSAKDLFQLMAKFQQMVRSEEKLLAIEESIVDALRDMDNEPLSRKFMHLWRERIAKLEKAA